jgi:hypothetical protein
MNQNVQKVIQLGALIDRNNEAIRQPQEENKQHMSSVEGLLLPHRNNQKPSKKIEDSLVKQIKKNIYIGRQLTDAQYEGLILKATKRKPVPVTPLARVTHISPKKLDKLLPAMKASGKINSVTFESKLSNGRKVKLVGWVAAA